MAYKGGRYQADTDRSMKANSRTGRLAGLVLVLSVASTIQAIGQAAPGQAAPVASPASAAAAPSGAAQPGSPAALPTEFRGIKLGMSIEEVETLLSKDSLFMYRGPEDVSLLPARNQSLIEASGDSFVKRAFFQFYDSKLWVIVIFLNPEKMDHYSLYTTLVAKYGDPALLDPKEARWEDKATRMALERPLTLRYMDMAVFTKLAEGSAAAAGAEELARRDFLGGL